MTDEKTQQPLGVASDLNNELEANKKHWYCFSYVGTLLDTEQQANACTYTGYDRQEISLVDINKNKENAGLKNNAVLIGLVYCGFMTRKQFVDGF